MLLSQLSAFTTRRGAQSLRGAIRRISHHSATRITSLDHLPKKGDAIGNYVVESHRRVDEFSLVALFLRHKSTGARHIHVARQDTNNVFAVGFSTIPTDSTGAAHILEHTTLCGSQKYPCRDPFFKMLHRSLATFMNAWTTPDTTMYPFSTTNATDMSNLMNVYLDATFFPKLDRLDFAQEGWRLEHEDVADKTSPIIFKGIVFNEMKGVYSSPDNYFAIRSQQLLHDLSPYSHVSGGDPLDIPDLSYQQLLDFHKTHYNPTNAVFYTYGDIPVEAHLDLIERETLSKFSATDLEKLDRSTPVWSEPRRVEETCGVDAVTSDPSRATRVSVGFLLKGLNDPRDEFAARILCAVLVDGSDSPFFKALIQSDLGSDFSSNTGLDTSLGDATFSVGAQNVREEDVEKVVDAVQATFEELASKGVSREAVDGMLHQVELSQKHESTSFGLRAGSILLPQAYHREAPEDLMDVLELKTHIAHFRQQLDQNPNYLSEMLKTFFIDNDHQLVLVMRPSEEHAKQREEREKARLESAVASLTEQKRRDIFERGLELQKRQQAEEDVSCLPTLAVSDIGEKGVYYVPEKTTFNVDNSSVDLYRNSQPTNGIAYWKAFVPVTSLPADLVPYLPVYFAALRSIGTEAMSHEQLAQRQRMIAGSMSCSSYIHNHHSSTAEHEMGFTLSAHALARNCQATFDLWGDMLSSPRWTDRKYLRDMIRMMAADAAASISHNGHQYAGSLAAGRLNPVSAIGETLNGLTQTVFLQQLSTIDDNQVDVVVEKLQQLSKMLLTLDRQGARHVINADDETMDVAEAGLSALLSRALQHGLCQNDTSQGQTPLQLSEVQAGLFGSSSSADRLFVRTPFEVSYAAKALPGLPYTHEDGPALTLVLNIMSSQFLHRVIREQGGAYGSGASMGGGQVRFFSYRDPNPMASVEAFENAVEWACQGNITERQLTEAKLSVFQSIDAPTAPSGRGQMLPSMGITPEMQQARRTRLLAATREDLINAAQTHLAKPQASSTVVVGAAAAASAKALPDGWDQVDLA